MKYLSIQTFQCGISVSGAATFTGGATINVLALNGATTSSEGSLFLGAHGTLEGGQLVLQKGTSQTYAAHLDNYSDQFRLMYGTNTGSTAVALAVSLATRQLILPAYTSDTSFSGSPAGYLAFDSAGNIITTSLALSGFVPTSRTLTINGVSYDLSANRSWTIATAGYTSKLQHQVKAGVSINKGQAVYVTGADGTNMIVGLASNASEATSSKTMGLLDATVSTNGFANVVTEGLLSGLDTSTAGTEGDPVWLGTGGNLIYGLTNKPYAPAHLVFIGIVTRKNANNGEIFVKVQNGFELNEIHDVDLKTNLPVNGELLGFNGTLWVNKTIAGWLGYTPANASGTTNYLSKFTGTSALGNSLVYDNGTNVGIGTASPTDKLHVEGTSYFNGNMGINGEGSGLTVDTAYGNNGRVGFMKYGGYEGMLVAGNATLLRLGHRTDSTLVAGGTPTIREELVITAAGNVGIGTTSPSTKLDVVGGIISTGTYQARMIGGAGGAYFGSMTAVPVIFQVNQNEVSRFDTNGNLGIGTTSPASRLHVYNDSDVWHTRIGGGSGELRIGGQTANGAVIQAYTPGGSQRDLYIQRDGGTVGIGTFSPTAILQINGAGGNGTPTLRLISTASDTFNWASSTEHANLTAGETSIHLIGKANSQYNQAYIGYRHVSDGSSSNMLTLGLYAADYLLNILGNGNVGIGTTSPANKLTIQSNSTQLRLETASDPSAYHTLIESNYNSSNPLNIYSSAAASNAMGTIVLSGITGVNTYLNSYYGIVFGTSTSSITASTVRMMITNGGNVGIGTTSPGEKLHVSGASVGITIDGSTASRTYYNRAGAYIWSTGLRAGDTKFHIFDERSTDRFVIDDSGNVGIGTAAPAYKLQVASGDIAIDYNRYLRGGSGGDWNLVNLYNGGTGDMEITMLNVNWYLRHNANATFAGNVGIGTTSPSTKLEVNGVITATGGNSTNWNTAYGWGNHASIGYLTSITRAQVHTAIYSTGGDANSYTAFGIYRNYAVNGPVAGHNTILNVMQTDGNYGFQIGSETNSAADGLYYRSKDATIGTWRQIASREWVNTQAFVPQARTLTINGTTYDLSANRSWTIATTTPGGSNTQFQYNSSGTLAGASALTYNSANNRVGINQASPGYDLDVNGQVRVQDKLRVGTVNSGNGVVHMSSTATINPTSTTIVWSQNVSVGMCAFIEYYILNANTATDQRAGTIIVTWNQSGTPTIAHTETTTPDIGSTTAINFTSSLVGSDARINAVSSSPHPYTMIMSYKYF